MVDLCHPILIDRQPQPQFVQQLSALLCAVLLAAQVWHLGANCVEHGGR